MTEISEVFRASFLLKETTKKENEPDPKNYPDPIVFALDYAEWEERKNG